MDQQQQSQHVLIVKVYTRHDDSSTNVLLFDENKNNIDSDADDIDIDGGSMLELDKKMKSINNKKRKIDQRNCRNNDKTVVQLPLLIGENWLQWYEHTNFLHYSQLSLDDTSTAAAASNIAAGNIILLPTILSLSEDISDMVHLPPTHDEINNSRPNTSQNSNSSSSLSVLYNNNNNHTNNNNTTSNHHHIQRLPSPTPLGGRRQCCYLCFDVMIDDTVMNSNNNNNENHNHEVASSIVSIKDMRDPIVSDSMILSSTPIWKHRNWTIHIQRHNRKKDKTNNTNDDEMLRRRISYRLHHGDSIIFRQSNNNMNNNNNNTNTNNNYNNNNHNIAMVVQYRNLNNIRYQSNNNDQKKKISVLLEDELILPDSYEDSQIKDNNNNTTVINDTATNIQVQQQQEQCIVNNLKSESNGLETRNENHDNNIVNNDSSSMQNEIATNTNHESLLLSQLTSQDDDDDDDDNVDNDNDNNVEGSYDISQVQQDHQILQIQQEQPTTENETIPNTSDNFYTSAATNDMNLLTQPTTIDTTTTIIREDNTFSTTTKSLVLAVTDHGKHIEDIDNVIVNEEDVEVGEDDDDDDTTIDPRRTIKDTKSIPNKQAKTSTLSNNNKVVGRTLQQQGTDTRKMPPPILTTTTITKSLQPASTVSTMNVPTTDTSNNGNKNDISPICSPNLLADTPRIMDRDGNEINSSIKQNDTMNQYDVLNEQVSSTIVDTPQHQHHKLLKSDDVQDDANNVNHSTSNIENSKNESSQDQQCIVDNPTTNTSIVPTQLHFDIKNDVVVEVNDIAGNEHHQNVKEIDDETKPELSTTNCNANNHSIEQETTMVQSTEPDTIENNNLEPIKETDVITIPTNTNDELANNDNNDNNSIELNESKQLSVPATENTPTTTSERTTRKRKNQSISLNEEELSKSSFISPRNVRSRRQQQQKQCQSSDVSLNTTSVSSTTRRRQSLTNKTSTTTTSTTTATPIGNNNSDHRSLSITSYAIRILVTGFDLNEKQKQMINKIPDAILIENISDAHYVTHIVVTDGISDIRRTCKLMIGICRTNNILILDWIIDSSKQRKVLDVSKYRIQSNASYCHAIEQQYQFSIRTTLKNIQNRDNNSTNSNDNNNNNLLFHGWYIYLCLKVAGNKAPNTMEFQYIIEASGGIYLSSLKNINDNDNTNNTNEASSTTTISTNTKKILIITSDPMTKVQEKHIQQQTQKHCMNNNNTTSTTATMNVSIEHRTTTWFFYTIMIQQIQL